MTSSELTTELSKMKNIQLMHVHKKPNSNESPTMVVWNFTKGPFIGITCLLKNGRTTSVTIPIASRTVDAFEAVLNQELTIVDDDHWIDPVAHTEWSIDQLPNNHLIYVLPYDSRK